MYDREDATWAYNYVRAAQVSGTRGKFQEIGTLQIWTNVVTHRYVLIGDTDIQLQLPFVLRADVQPSTEGGDGHCPAVRQDGKAVGEASVHPLLWRETPVHPSAASSTHLGVNKMSTDSQEDSPSNTIHAWMCS